MLSHFIGKGIVDIQMKKLTVGFVVQHENAIVHREGDKVCSQMTIYKGAPNLETRQVRGK